jgi:hypothetical protein
MSATYPLAVIIAFMAESIASASDHGLFVAPHAVNVMRSSDQGGESIGYLVPEPFPAPETLAFIEATLAKGGWRPARVGELRRFERSSLRCGWTDASDGDRVSLRLWSARWLDAKGGEVTYTLTYSLRAPRGASTPAHIGVSGLYFSKKEAARFRAKLDADPESFTKELRDWSVAAESGCR